MIDSLSSRTARHIRPPVQAAIAIVVLQLGAAIYFVSDSFDDMMHGPSRGFDASNVMEVMVAVALLAGVILSALFLRVLLESARRHDTALALARGAMADLVRLRFADWKLTPAESDVALFALKGFSTGEIAQLRGAATGTVRAQLSHVYAKAGVGSQAALMSAFIDDLLAGDDERGHN